VSKPQLTGYAAAAAAAPKPKAMAPNPKAIVPKPKAIVPKPKAIVPKPKAIVPKPKAIAHKRLNVVDDDSDDESEPSGLPWGGSGLSSIRGQKDGWYESDDEED
jgi:hypothetical protein